MSQPVPRIGEGADAETINATINYTMWSVFATAAPLPGDATTRAALVAAAQEAVAGSGVVVRGWYDVAGLRADADLMVWWHAATIEEVQDAYHRLLASDLGAFLEPVWSVVGLHRQAEFNKRHVPAYLAGEEPGDYLCVYPFVRSLDWYLLPDDERRKMLVDHGMAGREYPDVRANTVPAFALGDYEWILAFEGPDLGRIVELMWKLRYTEARRHVREETPFFTGPRVAVEQLLAKLP